MEKRGQATIFIILGVVIVIIIGVYSLLFYGIINKSFTFAQDLAEKQNDVDEYIRNCLKDVIKQKLKNIGLENLNLNDLANDPDVKKCFDLSNFEDGFEIITADVPEINHEFRNDNLEFGIIYPVTISKGDMNVTLTNFDSSLTLKTCGVDYLSIDERVKLRSSEESCIVLSGVNPEFLTPIYEIRAKDDNEVTLSFGYPDEEAAVIKKIDELTFGTVNSEIIEDENVFVPKIGNVRRNIRARVNSGFYSLGLCSFFGCPFYIVGVPPVTEGDIEEIREEDREEIPKNLCANVICPSNQYCFNGVCVEEAQPGGSGPGCFLEGTLVLMADESEKEINKLNQGDLILSYDFETDEEVITEVKSLSIKVRDSHLIINGNLKVTKEHPFSVSKNQWREAGKLKINDYVFDGRKFIKIETIETINTKVKVYNLQVEHPNNFFVESSSKRYLVHNKD